jgi:hypothetical protein
MLTFLRFLESQAAPMRTRVAAAIADMDLVQYP